MDLDKGNNANGNANNGSLSKAGNMLKETLSWAFTISVALVFALVFTKYVIFKAEVPTGSMKNTIMKDDKLIAWQIFSDVDRGEIVIFPAKEYSGEDVFYVKRVIGLPGETLEITDGKVYIDGEILHEDYLAEAMNEEDFGPYEIPEGCYFLMGDNRNYSGDARYWTYDKYVKKEDIVAKVFMRYSPNITFFGKPDYE